jgi:hypothetical protein
LNARPRRDARGDDVVDVELALLVQQHDRGSGEELTPRGAHFASAHLGGDVPGDIHFRGASTTKRFPPPSRRTRSRSARTIRER